MKKRPQIKEGDIVKLSKKGKKFPGDLPPNSTLRVVKVIGDGMDYYSLIGVKYKQYYFEFLRDDLWRTGFNINDEQSIDINAPLNNNGRNTCFMCGMPTKTIQLLLSGQQICANSDCKWFEN